MLLTCRGVLRICTSSSLFLQQNIAWRAPTKPTAHRNNRVTHTATASSRALWMGPVHTSTTMGGKVQRIRDLLHQHHEHPADGLQVIMDFDLTMTAPGSEQCHHMFETSLALPQELRGRLAPFFTSEIELTTREAWWDGFHAVLCDARITKEQVAAVAAGANLSLRSGTPELLLLLQEHGVPLLVVSAGITDIVAETLRLHGLLLDNVTVRANTMVFGQDGRLERFRESPPVHSRNKHKTVEREKSYFFDFHSHRRCVVVVGDKPGDANVAVGFVPDEHCLKVGFFDHSHEHPHPDLPPLPPPRPPLGVAASLASPAAPAPAENNGRVSGTGGERDTTSAALEGFEVLREFSGRIALPETAPAAAAADGAAATDTGIASSGGASFAFSEEPERLQGRPGSQGGGETILSGASDEAAVAASEMLRVYRESFDLVACEGHSMDLVAALVRFVVGASSSPHGSAAAAGARPGRGQSTPPPAR